MGPPCRHTGLHPFHTIFWFWAFQNNVFKPVFGENLSQLFQCYLSASAFLHRNLWLSSILFHKSASTLRFRSKYLAPLTHQLLDTISRNYSGISVHRGKASKIHAELFSSQHMEVFPILSSLCLLRQFDCLRDCWDMLRASLLKSMDSSETYQMLSFVSRQILI